MKKLVIDIETVGVPWEEHDPYVREYLIKGQTEDGAEETKRAGGLSPFRGKIVAIGVIRIDDGRSCALFEMPGQTDVRVERSGQRTYVSGTEKQILEKFWDWFDNDSRFISFNGRQFDGPFLMIRSAVNGVIPKRDLVGYRYQMHPNCDLREALNFYGTTNSRQFKFNLDLACKVFGVTTSKREGVDGRSVESWYRAGLHREIADYCLEDVRATLELYEKIAPTLLMFNKDFRESEERELRPKKEEPAVLTSSEAPFVQAVTQTSLALTASLDISDPAPVVSASHQAMVFEKLMAPEEPEEEIPTTIGE
jgi:3'-5' exonuclease